MGTVELYKADSSFTTWTHKATLDGSTRKFGDALAFMPSVSGNLHVCDQHCRLFVGNTDDGSVRVYAPSSGKWLLEDTWSRSPSSGFGTSISSAPGSRKVFIGTPQANNKRGGVECMEGVVQGGSSMTWRSCGSVAAPSKLGAGRMGQAVSAALSGSAVLMIAGAPDASRVLVYNELNHTF